MGEHFRCKIPDLYGIHSGFDLLLRPGYTALVGPNGAGKTTLLQQVKEIAKKRGYEVFFYSNTDNGGDTAKQSYLSEGNIDYLAAAACSSEGEQVALNFGRVVPKIGQLVKKAIANDTPLFILLDGLDSGASIDRARELMHLFELIEREAGVMPGGAEHEIYILVSINSYELARHMCMDVRTGETMLFSGYEDYANFICDYFKTRSNVSEKH